MAQKKDRDTWAKIRMWAAAAIGVSTIGSAIAPEVSDTLARHGYEFVERTARHSLSPLRDDDLDVAKLEWKDHSERSDLRAATVTVESSKGPVSFLLNQSDKISEEEFDGERMPYIKPSSVNHFSEKEIASITRAIDEISQTQTGQEMFSKIAGDLSGIVQISKAPDDARYAGRARGMIEVVGGQVIPHRDETHDVIRFSLHERALADGPFIPGAKSLAADGTALQASTAAVIVHEIGHTLEADPRSGHSRDERGVVAVHDHEGSVIDLAQEWERRYRNEVAEREGKPVDRTTLILYPSGEHNLPEAGIFSSGQLEFARTRAKLEHYGHLQEPGFSPDQIMAPSASAISALRLSDEEFDRHAGRLAYDAMVHTGYPTQEHSLGQVDDPEMSLSNAALWLDGKGGLESRDPVVRRATHEVESAMRIADYRETMAEKSVNGTDRKSALIDKMARMAPDQAIGLIEKAAAPGTVFSNIAVARDVQSDDGVYATASKFLKEHNEARRDFALSEDMRERASTLPVPGAAIVSTYKQVRFDGENLFPQGSPTGEVRRMAQATLDAGQESWRLKVQQATSVAMVEPAAKLAKRRDAEAR